MGERMSTPCKIQGSMNVWVNKCPGFVEDAEKTDVQSNGYFALHFSIK